MSATISYFSPEGKVVLEGGRNVTLPILYQRQQRSKGRMGKTIVKGEPRGMSGEESIKAL